MEIKETRIVHDTKFLKTFERDFSHNGTDGTWVFVAREDEPPTHEDKKPNAVVIVAILDQSRVSSIKGNRLVCTSEFRVPIGTRELGFPAGLIDEGETAEEAAVREFKEETGMDFYVTSVSPPNLYSSAGLSNESCQVVIGRARGVPNTDSNESLEDIQVELVSHEALHDILYAHNNIAVGAKAWCLMWGFYHSKFLYV